MQGYIPELLKYPGKHGAEKIKALRVLEREQAVEPDFSV